MGRRVGVVVPAFNEERQIGTVLETMPDYVDRVFVIDDCSTDRTAEHVSRWVKRLGSRVDLIQHHRRSGAGATIKSGYRAALDSGMEVVAVMTGDGQMDPNELPNILEPVAVGRVAYSKGSRLLSGVAWQKTPKGRYLGHAFLSAWTKVASGYWHVADAQCAYTAISAEALRLIAIDDLQHSDSYLNDLLIRLNVQNMPVAEVETTARHGVGERVATSTWSFVPTASLFLMRGFAFRLFEKYVVRDFHPIFFMYAAGALCGFVGLVLGLIAIGIKLAHGGVATSTVVLIAFLLTVGLQLSLFAMWTDLDYNKQLR